MTNPSDVFFRVGLVASVAGGAALGAWFSINPPSEQTIKMVEYAVAGGIAGFVAFLIVGLMAAMILDAPTGGAGE